MTEATNPSLDLLYRRLKKLQSRVRIHRWELRQRQHAKGTWYRLRRVLAGAESAWALPDQSVQSLEAAGVRTIDVGLELEPPLRWYWIDEETARAIAGGEQLPVKLERLLRRSPIGLVAFRP